MLWQYGNVASKSSDIYMVSWPWIAMASTWGQPSTGSNILTEYETELETCAARLSNDKS